MADVAGVGCLTPIDLEPLDLMNSGSSHLHKFQLVVLTIIQWPLGIPSSMEISLRSLRRRRQRYHILPGILQCPRW